MVFTHVTVALESIPEAMAITDAQGRILQVNAHTEALLGYDRRELIGQPMEMFLTERSRKEYALHQHCGPAASQVRPSGASLALSACRKDGKEVFVEIMLGPGPGGTVIHVVRDASMRRELDKFRDEYIGLISHDLKNPLSVIMLESRLLSHKLAAQHLSDEQHAVEVISQSASFIERMARELMEISYLDSAQVEIRHEETELGSFLKDVLERTVSTADRVRISLDIPAEVTALVDATRLERVVVNFVQNALKYAPETLLLVRLEALEHMAMVSVVDEGPGLTAEEVSFVFDKYRRTRTAGNSDGLGIGLYISRKIIEAHGGRIGVDSTPSQGSTFYFQVPLAAPKRKEVANPMALESSVEDCRALLRGLHVLLVDDEVNALSALGMLLAEDGLVVSTATSGEQALAKAEVSRFDAVVLDVQMPGMSGVSLLQALRARYPDIPAVFMTGYMRHQAGIAEAREATGAAYIGKPIALDELVRVLAGLITLNRQRTAVEVRPDGSASAQTPSSSHCFQALAVYR